VCIFVLLTGIVTFLTDGDVIEAAEKSRLLDQNTSSNHLGM